MAGHETIGLSDRIDRALERSDYISKGRLLNAASIIGGLLLWEFASGAVGSVILAPPTKVAFTFVGMVESGKLLTALGGSLQTLVVGYLIAVVIAVPLGFVIAQSKYAYWALNPYIDAIYTTPPIVYLPLVVIWFGLGFQGRVFFVFIFCFFEILINTFEGIRSTREEYMSVSRSFGASWWLNQSRVILPASLPFIFAGLRLGVGRAVRGVIVAELFLRLVNLGRLLQESGAIINTSVQLSVIITVAIMGVVLQKVVLVASRHYTPWYYTQGTGE